MHPAFTAAHIMRSKCREYAACVHTGTLYGSQTWPVEIGRYDQTREE